MDKSKITGIYAIRNKANGKMYVGSSKSVHYRWSRQHKPVLVKNEHYNKHLQSSWNKYGEDNFEFMVLEQCEESLLVEREEHWIEHYSSWDRKHGYNLVRIINGRKTIVVSEETRRKMEENWEKRLAIYRTTGVNKDILELYQEGVSKNEISKRLGIKRDTVYACLEYHDLHKNEGKGGLIKLTPSVKREVLAFRDEGMTWQEISEQTGISKTQLDRALAVRDGKYGGSKVKRDTYITVTEEVKEKAAELRSQGKSWKDIGEELGVSRQVFYWCGMAKEQPNMVRVKITPEMVAEALEMNKRGIKWVDIYKHFGCSKNSFRKYIQK